MSTSTIFPPPTVTIYVDPSCPFAWITSLWLREVRELRPETDLQFKLISLGVLNEDTDVTPEHRETLERSWGPARVAAAVYDRYGSAGLDRFHLGIGTQIHNNATDSLDTAIRAGLASAQLDEALCDAVSDTAFDDLLRTHTSEAVLKAGEGLGTPIVEVGDVAFFGPVITAVPRGDAALEMFDGVVAVASNPNFAELKRRRRDELEFI